MNIHDIAATETSMETFDNQQCVVISAKTHILKGWNGSCPCEQICLVFTTDILAVISIQLDSTVSFTFLR